MSPPLKKLRRSNSTAKAVRVPPRPVNKTGTFARKVRAALNTEIKEYNQAQGSFAGASGGAVISLNNVAQNTDINNRIGRHIAPKGLDFEYQIFPPTAGTIGDFHTFWIVWDKQSDTVVPAFATIMDTTTSVLSQCFINTLNNRDRFVLLHTERSFVSGPASTGQQINNFGRFFIPLSKFEQCEFVSAVTAVPNTGAIYLVVGTTTNSGSSLSQAQISYNSKFTFTDM